MILEPLKVLDVQRIGNMDEGIQAGITEESLPFIFELVSKQLYSNPIGSVIREITSNCFDSHIEAGVEDPVIISKTHSIEEGYFIEFQDVGVGLSPERVQNIYMNYFSSTKRSDNKQIGAFGIGSKTPLTYADMFYITTVFDGIRYEYIFHKGESKPTIELLNQEKTEEHNGTIIKINMERGDVNKFQEQLNFQLAYFDNVYFRGWGISNDYDIYEGKYFKFRSDIDQYNTLIHLCIGKVRYPIDFNRVDIPVQYRKIPVAVKFEIGELKITPSREALRYDDEGIKLISERVSQAAKEIIELFEAQNPEVEDLRQYIQVMKDTAKITFDVEKGHQLYLWASSGMSKNFRFKPLAGVAIKKIPTDLFFMWKVVGILKYSTYIPYKYDVRVENETIVNRKFMILEKEDRISLYTNAHINAENSGYYEYYIIQRKEIEFNSVSNLLDIKESKTIGKAKTIMQYMKVINEIVYKEGTLYRSHKPTDEWIAEYKRGIRESSAAWIRKHNKKIFVRDVANNFRGMEVKEYDLKNRTGILVYGFRGDKQLLTNISLTVRTNRQSVRNTVYSKRGLVFFVIQIAEGVEKSILGAKKTIYCKDFLETRYIREIVTAIQVHELIVELGVKGHDLKKDLLKDFEEDFKTLNKGIEKFYGGGNNSLYNHDIKLIPKMLEPVEGFKKKYEGIKIPLMNSINYYILNDDENLKEYIEYLKYKKIRLKNQYYLKSKEQLKYEEGVKQILKTLREPIKNNLLTFTLNQTENGQEQNIDS